MRARFHLGLIEDISGNHEQAMKHWMICAEDGFDPSLKAIRKAYSNGNTTKDMFEKALRVHKDAKDAMKSVQRDAAAGDPNKYSSTG